MRPAIVANGKCTISSCNVSLHGLPTPKSSEYMLRARMIYAGSTQLLINAYDTGGTQLKLQGAEALIDSTGNAQNVLRRIQVYVSLLSACNPQSGDCPSNYAIQSGSSICKRFAVYTGYFSIPSDLVSQDPDNPMCKSVTYMPPISGSVGQAGFTGQNPCHLNNTCPPAGVGGSPTTGVYWNRILTNISTVNPASIVSCQWAWGDRTPNGGGPASNPGNACLPGQKISHVYMPDTPPGGPSATYSGVCYTYSATLTLNMVGGGASSSTNTVKAPGGAGVTCTSQVNY